MSEQNPIVDIKPKHSQNITLAEDKIMANRFRIKERKDFSALEQVLDKKTRILIEKLIRTESIKSITGVINSGKESVVFQVVGPNDEPLALKIFKRTAMDFRRREKYFDGDFRFRSRHLRRNVHKMVDMWAEKEFRNLKKIFREKVLCPEPLILKSHLMLMSFIGEGDEASPRLKEAEIAEEQIPSIYKQCVIILRRFFKECNLVHADFSEYNLLLRSGKVVVIDVGSAVSHTHPGYHEFLLADCRNISNFFAKKNFPILSLKDLFTYVTTGKIIQGSDSKSLDEIMDSLKNDSLENVRKHPTAENDSVEATLKSLCLTSLFEIDEEQCLKESTKQIASHLLTNAESAINEQEPESELETDSMENGEITSENDVKILKKKMTKEEVREMRKENKKVVKAENRLRRLTKRPKNVKRRMEKLIRRKKKP